MSHKFCLLVYRKAGHYTYSLMGYQIPLTCTVYCYHLAEYFDTPVRVTGPPELCFSQTCPCYHGSSHFSQMQSRPHALFWLSTKVIKTAWQAQWPQNEKGMTLGWLLASFLSLLAFSMQVSTYKIQNSLHSQAPFIKTHS